MVQSMDEVVKKMKTCLGQLAETANVEPSAMALVDRQMINIALNVGRETTLPTGVG